MSGCEDNTVKMTPEDTVNTWFLSHYEDDWEMYNTVMMEGHKADLSLPAPNYGLISVNINGIEEYRGEKFNSRANMYIDSPLGKSWGLRDADNMTIVLADAELVQDGTMVSPSSYTEWEFILIRKNKHSPWKIANFGMGGLSYAEEFGNQSVD